MNNTNATKELPYHIKHREVRKEYYLQYRAKNLEVIKAKAKQYGKVNSNKVRNRLRNRYHNDFNYRMSCLLSNRIYKALKLSRAPKTDRATSLLGCSIENFKQHIEQQFEKGMSWDNYAITTWHIDHIRPCASFDLTNPEQQKECFHYSNLRPLWSNNNYFKSSKFEGKKHYYKKV